MFAGEPGAGAITICLTGPSDDEQSMLDAQHIAAWDPARVLAEVAAKRAILDLHAQMECVNCADAGRGTGTSCLTCHHGGEAGTPFYDGTCLTVRILAQPFVGHPDFSEDWRQP